MYKPYRSRQIFMGLYVTVSGSEQLEFEWKKKGKVMRKGSKVALVCCSNGLSVDSVGVVEQLEESLVEAGLEVVKSPYIFQKQSVFSGTAKQRAEALMQFYEDKSIQAVYDLSGGDIANEILPYLDFQKIQENPKYFFGYSDLTTVLNAIYTKTRNKGILYQIRNIVGGHLEKGRSDTELSVAGMQWREFVDFVEEEKGDCLGRLGEFSYDWLQGNSMCGILVGGNIRCLLKLAGTPYFPDMEGKILLLEARSGQVAQLTTYISQLRQMGVFEQAAGILLGTFSQMEREEQTPDVATLFRQQVGGDIPIAKTRQIGHGVDSKAVQIGGYYEFE